MDVQSIKNAINNFMDANTQMAGVLRQVRDAHGARRQMMMVILQGAPHRTYEKIAAGATITDESIAHALHGLEEINKELIVYLQRISN